MFLKYGSICFARNNVNFNSILDLKAQMEKKILSFTSGFFLDISKKTQGQKNSSQKKTQANFRKTQANHSKTQ